MIATVTSGLPTTSVGTAAVTAAATLLAAVLAWMPGARQRRADRLRRAAEDHQALRSAVTDALPHISAAYQNVRDALLEPVTRAEQRAALAKATKDLEVVRGDGARIVAVDAHALTSDLFVAQDAAYLALKDMVWFLRRALDLGLDEDPTYESQAAMLCEDANSALRHYLAVVNRRIAPQPRRRRVAVLWRALASGAARHPVVTGSGATLVAGGVAALLLLT